MKTKKAKGPVPVLRDSRVCFAIAFFKTAAEAEEYGRIVVTRGDRYNGGYFHGMQCGRDSSFDYMDDKHGPLFAVTER